MPAPGLDPSPRRYSPSVTLVRRSARGAASAPERTTVEDIEGWLLGAAVAENDLLALFESLAWRAAAAGLPLDRASLHVGTLHPELYGFSWVWNRSDGLCDETRVPQASLETDSYKRNPLYRVIEHGETVRCDSRDPAAAERFPLMAELAAGGIADYLALPIGGGETYHNAVTVATQRPGGFTDAEVEAIARLLRVFALHVERHIVLRIVGNVLDTYLGSAAGGRVLAGTIARGSGEAIRAVVWISDLRGFTDLTDRLAGADVTALLNAYFERLAGAVLDHGGEVLKFIGDGLLAVFPLAAVGGSAPAEPERDAAERALAAAEQALDAIAALNQEPPAALRKIAGWQPLRTGIALHEGEVFFGNVGAAERLDFTVIGRAVNEASRVEALCKTLGRAVLITEPVARRLDRPLDDLGRHPLRGLARPIALFSPRRSGEA